jgi:hypothetical protein
VDLNPIQHARRVVNDALAIYFADITLATAFVARWCVVTEGRGRRWGVSGARQRTDAAGWRGPLQHAPSVPGSEGDCRSTATSGDARWLRLLMLHFDQGRALPLLWRRIWATLDAAPRRV